MLSERIEDALVDIIEQHVRNGLQAAAEAGASSERERLMEVVCDGCGRPFTKDRTCSWELAPGSGAHSDGLGWHNLPVTRAEYLRLHPEAT